MLIASLVGLGLTAISLILVVRWLGRERRSRTSSRWDGRNLGTLIVLLVGAFVASPVLYLLLRGGDPGVAARTAVFMFGVCVLFLPMAVQQVRYERRRERRGRR